VAREAANSSVGLGAGVITTGLGSRPVDEQPVTAYAAIRFRTCYCGFGGDGPRVLWVMAMPPRVRRYMLLYETACAPWLSCAREHPPHPSTTEMSDMFDGDMRR
jgi:hypothetical protein